MSLAILGLGTAVPEAYVDQGIAAAITAGLCCRTAEHRTWLPLIYSQSGIHGRHLVFDQAVIDDVVNGTRHSGSPFLPSGAADDAGPTTAVRMREYRRHAGRLAAQSSRLALQAAEVAPRRITHLVTVSCTGFHAPGFDLELIRRLPLSPAVARTHIGFMGCHGALNGLRVAKAFAAEPSARVLICATELCGLHFHYGWDPQQMIANALFADGSAAMVGAGDAATGSWRLVANSSVVIPNSADAMSWSVGDHGFAMTLSRDVPQLISRHLRPWLMEWLASHGVTPAAVTGWAVHPGGPKVLDAVAESMDLNSEALAESRSVLADYGNMSSPTVLFILERLMRRPMAGPIVALGFGPGMVTEAALLQVS